ncbi:MAG: hypothetical protein D3910_06085 [Candidatus Electrothrix sp. ATG2]|nr:hypothetical protein [Candidatus Electrothrix sp. ATG2]
MNDILNCWEFKECGREPGGKNIFLYGVCTVAVASRFDGIHDGKNGGRCCWIVAYTENEGAGVPCSGGFDECRGCDFYKMVMQYSEPLVVI